MTPATPAAATATPVAATPDPRHGKMSKEMVEFLKNQPLIPPVVESNIDKRESQHDQLDVMEAKPHPPKRSTESEHDDQLEARGIFKDPYKPRLPTWEELTFKEVVDMDEPRIPHYDSVLYKDSPKREKKPKDRRDQVLQAEIVPEMEQEPPAPSSHEAVATPTRRSLEFMKKIEYVMPTPTPSHHHVQIGASGNFTEEVAEQMDNVKTWANKVEHNKEVDAQIENVQNWADSIQHNKEVDEQFENVENWAGRVQHDKEVAAQFENVDEWAEGVEHRKPAPAHHHVHGSGNGNYSQALAERLQRDQELLRHRHTNGTGLGSHNLTHHPMGHAHVEHDKEVDEEFENVQNWAERVQHDKEAHGNYSQELAERFQRDQELLRHHHTNGTGLGSYNLTHHPSGHTHVGYERVGEAESESESEIESESESEDESDEEEEAIKTKVDEVEKQSGAFSPTPTPLIARADDRADMITSRQVEYKHDLLLSYMHLSQNQRNEQNSIARAKTRTRRDELGPPAMITSIPDRTLTYDQRETNVMEVIMDENIENAITVSKWFTRPTTRDSSVPSTTSVEPRDQALQARKADITQLSVYQPVDGKHDKHQVVAFHGEHKTFTKDFIFAMDGNKTLSTKEESTVTDGRPAHKTHFWHTKATPTTITHKGILDRKDVASPLAAQDTGPDAFRSQWDELNTFPDSPTFSITEQPVLTPVPTESPTPNPLVMPWDKDASELISEAVFSTAKPVEARSAQVTQAPAMHLPETHKVVAFDGRNRTLDFVVAMDGTKAVSSNILDVTDGRPAATTVFPPPEGSTVTEIVFMTGKPVEARNVQGKKQPFTMETEGVVYTTANTPTHSLHDEHHVVAFHGNNQTFTMDFAVAMDGTKTVSLGSGTEVKDGRHAVVTAFQPNVDTHTHTLTPRTIHKVFMGINSLYTSFADLPPAGTHIVAYGSPTSTISMDVVLDEAGSIVWDQYATEAGGRAAELTVMMPVDKRSLAHIQTPRAVESVPTPAALAASIASAASRSSKLAWLSEMGYASPSFDVEKSMSTAVRTTRAHHHRQTPRAAESVPMSTAVNGVEVETVILTADAHKADETHYGIKGLSDGEAAWVGFGVALAAFAGMVVVYLLVRCFRRRRVARRNQERREQVLREGVDKV